MANVKINGLTYRNISPSLWQSPLDGKVYNQYSMDILKRFPNGYPRSTSNSWGTTKIWASSWLPTDPDANISSLGIGLIRQTPALEGGATAGSIPENMGNVNRFEYVKPSVYFMICAGDGGYENNYTPYGSGGATAFTNGNCFTPYTSDSGRMRAIRDRLLELPEGYRSINPRRYDQGSLFLQGPLVPWWDSYSNGVTYSIWATSAGLTLQNDARLTFSKLQSIGGLIDYINFDMEQVGEMYAKYDPVDANALWDSRVNAIASESQYNLPYLGTSSFSSILFEFPGFTLNDILNANYHPQLNPSYVYWDRAIASSFSAWVNEYLVKPIRDSYPEVKVSNYNFYNLLNTDYFYDEQLHPKISKGLVGDAPAPVLYGGINAPLVYGVMQSDPTRIIRNNIPGVTANPSTFPNTAWNNLLVLIQNMRAVKRSNPTKPIRPWVASINWYENAFTVVPPWTTNSTNRGFYYELIRHLALTGAELFNYFNPDDWTDDTNPFSSPNWFSTNLTRLNDTLTDINNQTGGFRINCVSTEKLSFLANHILSGVQTGDTTYVWRVTANSGYRVRYNGDLVTLDSDRGAWITSNTSSITVTSEVDA